MSHIHTIIEEWGLEHNFDDITVNYNSTNPTDIHADEEQDNGPDYLQEVGYYDDDEEEEENDLTQTIYTDPPSQGSVTQWSQDSQAQISQDSEVIDLEPQGSRSNARIAVAAPQAESSRSHVQNMDITFVSDNASDISKALKYHGNYKWFGCAGHHLNLVVRNGFKKNLSAALLLKKMLKNCLSCKL